MRTSVLPSCYVSTSAPGGAYPWSAGEQTMMGLGSLVGVIKYRLAAVVALVLFFNHMAFAQDTAIDKTNGVTHQIPGIETTQMATVIAISPYVQFLIAVDEKQLRVSGCIATTRDRSRIADLIGILDRDEVRIDIGRLSSIHDLREAIDLTLADGTEVSLLFNKQYIGKSATEGVLKGSGANKHVPIFGNADLPSDLRDWVAKTEDLTIGGGVSSQHNCEILRRFLSDRK